MSQTIHEIRAIATANVDRFVRGIGRAINSTASLQRAWSNAARGVSKAATRITGAVGVIAGVATKRFAEFEETMVRVQAVTNSTNDQFAELQQTAKDQGASTRFTALQSAEAMESLGLAGLGVKEIVDALPGSLQLASAAQLDIGTAADIAAKTMRAYGLEATDLTRINDTLVSTFTRANTDLTQLAEALKPVGPVAKSLGVDLETTTAILAKMADAGFQGSLGGTSLRNILAKLAGATPAVTNKLAKMGIVTRDAAGNMRPLLDILEDIQRAGMDGGKILELFGARGGPQLSALLDAGIGSIREFRDGLVEAEGIAARLEKSNLDTFAGQFDLLKSAIDGVLMEVGDGLNPEIRELVQLMTAWLSANKSEVVDEMVEAMSSMVATGKDIIDWLIEAGPAIRDTGSAMWTFLEPVLEFLKAHPELVAAFATLKAASLFGITDAVLGLGGAFGKTGFSLVALISKLSMFETKLGQGRDALGRYTAGAKGVESALSQLKVVGFAAAVAGIVWLATKIYEANGDLQKLREEVKRTADLDRSLRRLQDREFQSSMRAIQAAPIKNRRAMIEAEIEKANKNLAGQKASIGGIRAEVERLSTTWNTMTGNKVLETHQSELERFEARAQRTTDRIQDLKDMLRQFDDDADRRSQRPSAGLPPGASNLSSELTISGENATTELEQAFEAGGESAAEKITESLRNAEIEKLERDAPGFRGVRDFIGQESVASTDVEQFASQLEGVAPELARRFAEKFASVSSQASSEVLDRLALGFVQHVNRTREADAELQRVSQQSSAAVSRFGQRLAGLKEKLPNDVIEDLGGKALRAQKDLAAGVLTFNQFTQVMTALDKATRKAVEAAKMKEQQERRERMLRLLQGKGSQSDFEFLAEQQRAARMAAFDRQLQSTFDSFFCLNQELPRTVTGLAGLNDGLDRVSTAMTSRARSIASPEQASGALSQLGRFLSSRDGQITSAFNNLQLAFQRLQIADTYRERQAVLADIRDLRAELAALQAPVQSPFVGGPSFGDGDPSAFGESTTIVQNVSLDFPNLTKMSNAELDTLATELDRLRGRRGADV